MSMIYLHSKDRCYPIPVPEPQAGPGSFSLFKEPHSPEIHLSLTNFVIPFTFIVVNRKDHSFAQAFKLLFGSIRA
ncbi:hypothetical protein MJO28_014272 [Puccinia striiformis f. sp. tritici]|uniref:Uncharacterized protein n=1 Tax=Puccinia striiformis f. sp. tritici TaxID=168172 RepID=A0ACC0DUU8_9BASI|nr:hypothetical protein MJO28_014272 [Puccinia striiformis f. sp. tritici]